MSFGSRAQLFSSVGAIIHLSGIATASLLGSLSYREDLARKDAQHTSPVSLESFQGDVIERSADLPVLVDFWADWCTPCRIIAPVLERVARRYAGRAVIAKLEVDEGRNMKLAGQHKVRGFPTVILFRDGVERARFSGVRTEREIAQLIEAHL